MNDNSPMLSRPPDNSPMLGGDRAISTDCPECGSPRMRDFFGKWICLICIDIRQKFIKVAEKSKCAWCGEYETLEPYDHESMMQEFASIYPTDIDSSAYGLYHCMACGQVHHVYRANGKIRVAWIDEPTQEY